MLGLYQIWTVPVTEGIIKANQVLAVSMDSYSDQLLPALQQAMTANIEGVDASIATFNDVQLQNVTSYNQQKCERQLNIASHGDTCFLFSKVHRLRHLGRRAQHLCVHRLLQGRGRHVPQRQRAYRQGVRRPRDQ